MPRETREGWPLLTVETEGTQRVQMKEVLPWLVRWLVMPVQEILFSLGCSCRQNTNLFFPHRRHYFNSFDTIAQQPGQAAELGRLSLSMCL